MLDKLIALLQKELEAAQAERDSWHAGVDYAYNDGLYDGFGISMEYLIRAEHGVFEQRDRLAAEGPA